MMCLIKKNNTEKSSKKIRFMNLKTVNLRKRNKIIIAINVKQ